MRRDRADVALLFDVLEAARDIVSYLNGPTRDDYAKQSLLRAGVERKLEIIGEACRKISDEFRSAHPEIPWRKIISTRHIVAHDYDQIDDEVIWRIATVYVPELIGQLAPLVPAPPVSEEED